MEKGAPNAPLAIQRRPSSLRELVGSDEAMSIVLAFLGAVNCAVGEKKDERPLADSLALGLVLPGVCVASCAVVGPVEAALLGADTTLGGLRLHRSSTWPCLFAALKVNTGLRKLRLDECGLEPGDVALLLEALAANASLVEVDLCGNALGEAGGRALATVLEPNTTLRVLKLGCALLGDVGGREVAAALATNTGLWELVLAQNHLGEGSGHAIAAALTTNTTLRKLSLSWNSELGDGAWVSLFEAVVCNNNLQELLLVGAGMGRASGVALANVVSMNSTLQVLDLSKNSLGRAEDGSGSSSWPQLLAALTSNVGLHTLRLTTCGLAQNDGQVLARALGQRSSGTLRELSLGDNPNLGDSACSAIIAASLKPDSVLRDLNMAATGMGRAAGRSLTRCLRANCTLAVLELSSNTLGGSDRGGVSGWPEVFAALAVNTGLQTLRLSCCGLNKRDVKALAAALRANRVLRELGLWANRLGDDAARVLAPALVTNRALRKLGLGFNQLGDDTAFAFATLLETNTALRELSFSDGGIGASAKRALVLAGRRAGCSVTL